MPEIDWNDRQLIDALQQPFKETNELWARKARQMITASQWPWPNPPTLRDIVDDGDLRRSYKAFPLPPFAYDHEWGVDYALPVHEGAVFKDGRSMPARPWTRITFQRFDFGEVFARIARSRLGRVQ